MNIPDGGRNFEAPTTQTEEAPATQIATREEAAPIGGQVRTELEDVLNNLA